MSFVLDFLATYGTWEPIISIGSEYLVSLLLLIHLYYILMKLEHLSDIIWIIIDIFFVFDTLFGQFWPFLASYKNIESNISIVKKWIFSIFIVTYQLVLHTGEIRAPQWHYLNHYWWFCVFDPLFVNFWLFFSSYGTLEPDISIISGYLVSLLLLIYLSTYWWN